MTSEFNPTKMGLSECLLVHSKFSSHPLIKTADKATQVSYSVQRAVNPALDLKQLVLFIRFEARLLHEAGFSVVDFESVFRFVFEIEDLETLVEVSEEGKVGHINDNLLIAATSIATSTVRGAVLPLYSNTWLHKFLMPTIPIAEIAAMQYFKIGDYLPDWARQTEGKPEEMDDSQSGLA